MANCAQCGRKLPPLAFRKICQWCVQHEAAKRGEMNDDAPQPVMAVPWVRRESSIPVTHVVFGANAAIFLAMALASSSIDDFPGQILVHFGANFGPYTLSGDWWRLLTYMFLHGGIFHVAINMWCLWSLGTLCESLYGRWTYAAVYLITGIAGGLTSVAWNPQVLSVGASGALFGLSGALIASIYLGEFSLAGISIKGTLTSLIFFAAFSLYFGFVSSGIDNGCHIGGLISGLILGALIARLAPQEDAPVRRITILAVVALAVAVCAFGVRSWRGSPYRIARALDALSDKSPDRAVADLKALARQQPDSAEVHLSLGRTYFGQGNFSQAEAEFQRALQVQPQSNAARLDLGMTYLNENRPQDAKAAFGKILSQDAHDADAHYGMGLALSEEEKYQEAIAEFKTAATEGVRGSGVYFEMGRSYAKLKMFDDAIAAYLKEKETTGDDPDVETALAAAYDAKGMTQQAAEAKNKSVELRSQPHN